MSAQPETPLVTCTCEQRLVADYDHDQHCDLWKDDDYTRGWAEWDILDQKLVYLKDDLHLPDGFTIDPLPAGKAECVCDPQKLWTCIPCGVSRRTDKDQWEWSTTPKVGFMAAPLCRHYGRALTFPDGTTVWGSSAHTRHKDEAIPDFGIYLDPVWRPECFNFGIPWADYGLPRIDWSLVVHALTEGVRLARDGQNVEVGCIGGHGRTGTALACMGVLCGLGADEAIAYVRAHYCHKAVESEVQEWFVAWFWADHHGEEPPPRPPEPVWEQKTLPLPGQATPPVPVNDKETK